MSDETYNGWTNYATWRVNLELCADMIDSLLADVNNGDKTKFASVGELANTLRDDVDACVTEWGETEHTLAADYARAFLADVNYDEISQLAVEGDPDLLVSEEDDEEDDD